MKKTALILTEGFEEVEALTTVDLLRRAQIVCDTVSLEGTETVRGSHGITVQVDAAFTGIDFDSYDGIILPGGPGHVRLAESGALLALLKKFYAEGKLTAAICAAPTVLAKAGLLEGKKAVCYPGMEGQLDGADAGEEPVAVDGTVITSRGVGTAIPFALALIAYLNDAVQADSLAAEIVYR